MRYVVLIRVDENRAEEPPAELIDAMFAHVADERHAKVVTDAGLTPSSAAIRVASRGGEVMMTDGPFAETKEVIGGYGMYEVRSVEEAVEWSRRFMQIHLDTWPGFEGTSVVRQVFGPDDAQPGM